ncbi:MAG TPA: hypothetical protein ENI23_16420 [bacterium]|nr:hypothetical protein [bacterium]
MTQSSLYPDQGFKGSPIKKFVTSKYFNPNEGGAKRLITPMALKQLYGEETNSLPQYRHNKRPDGYTYRLIFIDHESEDMERFYENCYEGFVRDIKEQGVEIGEKYYVWVERPGTRYVWRFVRLNRGTQDEITTTENGGGEKTV